MTGGAGGNANKLSAFDGSAAGIGSLAPKSSYIASAGRGGGTPPSAAREAVLALQSRRASPLPVGEAALPWAVAMEEATPHALLQLPLGPRTLPVVHVKFGRPSSVQLSSLELGSCGSWLLRSVCRTAESNST